MALGIDALHKMGIIHRDIKPENMLVDRGIIKIFDFGTAYNNKLEPVTREGKYAEDFVGTEAYRPPECDNKTQYGPMVDYWALGCVVFDLIVGDVSPRFGSLHAQFALMRVR